MPHRHLGTLGETLVAHWVRTQGWQILDQSWHCRWGELDVVARQIQPPRTLAFIEVKTRSAGNWDADGLLAITPQKRAKLWKTAQLFLAQHPDLADFPCRFDVALVYCQRGKAPPASAEFQLPVSLRLGQPVLLDSYWLTIQTYLESAFEL